MRRELLTPGLGETVGVRVYSKAYGRTYQAIALPSFSVWDRCESTCYCNFVK
ncbi:hypothetical protein LINPERHAP1_LOCUS4374 [Linum perenne]